jgi:hypothetical protein
VNCESWRSSAAAAKEANPSSRSVALLLFWPNIGLQGPARVFTWECYGVVPILGQLGLDPSALDIGTGNARRAFLAGSNLRVDDCTLASRLGKQQLSKHSTKAHPPLVSKSAQRQRQSKAASLVVATATPQGEQAEAVNSGKVMPVLRNSRHEKFALIVAKGQPDLRRTGK